MIGLIGSGNMARALALGWGEPVLCTDSGSGRAKELAALVGGEAVASNRELAERADVVILAHKPAQLRSVAEEIAGAPRVVVSLLARTTQAQLREAYPGVPAFRVEPNTPVEVRQGVLAFAQPDVEVDPAMHDELRELFGRVGTVVEVPGGAHARRRRRLRRRPRLLGAARRGPGRRGDPTRHEARRRRHARDGDDGRLRRPAARAENDTLALRRAVTSPGGTTARGLAALERGGIRAAFAEAMDDVVDP